MKERRRYSRVPVNKQVWVCDFDAMDTETPPDNPKECLIVDISEGGACIQCSDRYLEGQPLAFTYQDIMEDGLRPVIGVVMWSKRISETGYRHGIKFLGLSTQMLRRIQDQVFRMNGGNERPF